MDREIDNKILNYRITIQKLEVKNFTKYFTIINLIIKLFFKEELSLYRNGTTSQELLDFVAEKDIEIESLKSKIIESTENYRKLAKTSRDVLEKNESLHLDLQNLNEQNIDLNEKLNASEIQINEHLHHINILELDKNRYEEYNHENTLRILSLENDLSERNENIDKLQQRCAALVSEKSDKNKLYEKEKTDRTKQVNELRVNIILYKYICIANIFHIYSIYLHIYIYSLM